MENRVLQFIQSIHDFEQEHDLFHLKDEQGIYYWDVIRLKVLEKLFYSEIVRENKTASSLVAPPAQSSLKRLLKVFKWTWWFFINQINFIFFTPRKKWLFFHISRFQHRELKKTYDAVADEIYESLKAEATAIETFKNAQTDITRIGNRFQTFHLYTYRIMYRKRHFKAGKTYVVSELLKARYPKTATENWDHLIQETILEFKAESLFAERVLRKLKPKGIFFTGGAKGIVFAARKLSIKTIEIQHSPLNKADLCYSYNPKLNYEHILTIPEYLLVNSEEWEKRIYYPPKFVPVGSNYFHESSKFNPISSPRKTILFVSDPVNHDWIKNYILNFAASNDLQDYRLVFKLHSAETDRYPEAISAFESIPQVQVILNERNISDLLDESCATFIIYSTVAYQAIQKGVPVFLLKTGYYEGGYDLFDLELVRLIDLDQAISMDDISKFQLKSPQQITFFEAFDEQKLKAFIHNLK